MKKRRDRTSFLSGKEKYHRVDEYPLGGLHIRPKEAWVRLALREDEDPLSTLQHAKPHHLLVGEGELQLAR